ncbi:MAG: NADH-quinone oxidoreductase subunit C [Cytophagaceae bacterium]
MTFEEIKDLLTAKFGDAVVLEETPGHQPQFVIPASSLVEVCLELFRNEKTYFDFLSCVTGIDNGPEKGNMEVIYNLYSIPYGHALTLKVIIRRNLEGEPLPSVPSLVSVWKSANWHERETFDLLGIVFDGHPDMRRILLPADWEGFPLRKDYKLQDYYHGIKTVY